MKWINAKEELPKKSGKYLTAHKAHKGYPVAQKDYVVLYFNSEKSQWEIKMYDFCEEKVEAYKVNVDFWCPILIEGDIATEDIELTKEQLSRNDDIDNTVYQMLLTLLEKSEEEFPWNMGVIGDVTDAIEDVLEKKGYHVRHPGIVHEKDGTQHYEE